MAGSAIDRNGLEAFVAVVRAGTVREAAERLGRTQPSITARVLALEADWGVRLFYRRARGMAPTPEAVRLLPLADRALEALQAVDRAVGRPPEPDEVRVGCGDALGRVVLPEALRALQRSTPSVDVRVVEGPRPHLLERLRRGDIDVALVASDGPDETALDSNDFESAPVVDSPVLLLRAGDPVRRPRPARVGDLTDRRWVALQVGSAFRRHVERAFAGAGLRFRPSVEVGNLSMVRRFVAAGLGEALVPAVAFRDEDRPPGVRAVPVRDLPPLRYLRVWRAGSPLPDSVRRLVAYLDESARGRGR